MATAAKKRPASSQALMELGLEVMSVGILTVIAGFSDDAGTVIVLFMVAFWLLFMVQNASLFSSVSGVFTSLVSGG